MSKTDRETINRLHRVQGQLRGLERMVAEGADCEEVLTQLSAAKGALDRLGISMISLKLRECAADADWDEKVDAMLKRFLKGAAY